MSDEIVDSGVSWCRYCIDPRADKRAGESLICFVLVMFTFFMLLLLLFIFFLVIPVMATVPIAHHKLLNYYITWVDGGRGNA